MSEKTDVWQGTLALMVLKALEALGSLHGYIASAWGISDNHRKARYCKSTRADHKRLAEETQKWETTTEILARFFAPQEGS